MGFYVQCSSFIILYFYAWFLIIWYMIVYHKSLKTSKNDEPKPPALTMLGRSFVRRLLSSWSCWIPLNGGLFNVGSAKPWVSTLILDELGVAPF